jgi:tryptophan synthase alpha chain
MGYLNPIMRLGETRFLDACLEAGVDALIVPDLPPEEADGLAALARARGVGVVFLLAPTSSEARCAEVAARATGFVYYVSVTGVTGARAALPPDLGHRLARVRANSPLPVVVGFGVSRPEQAAALGREADGVVVGSAIVAQIAEAGAPDEAAARVRGLVRSLRDALKGDISGETEGEIACSS